MAELKPGVPLSYCSVLCFLSLVQDLKGLGYEKGKPVGLVGVTELSDAQKKQLKEQQEVRPQAGDSALPLDEGLREYQCMSAN